MIVTAVSALLGLIGSVIPNVLSIYKDGRDKKHELDIFRLQMELSKMGHTQRLEEIGIEADISEAKSLYKHAAVPSGVRWIEGLNASVRPILTYSFFIVFVMVKIGLLVMAVENGATVFDGLILIWSVETMALFTAIMTFWFGNRTFMKLRGL